MKNISGNRRSLLVAAGVATALPLQNAVSATLKERSPSATSDASGALKKMHPPKWLMDFWKEIDDKTWGKGFDCFSDNAVGHLGVSDWHGREGIRKGLRDFVDKNLTATHEVAEYWDSPKLKVFRGFVTMVFNDKSIPTARPTMQHFFYMDDKDPTKVIAWYGSVGPTSF